MSVEQKFKVGDRVRIDWASSPYSGIPEIYRNEGTICVIGEGRMRIEVDRFCIGDDAHCLSFEPEWLSPAPTTSGPYMAQHNADGTLTLTPVQEAEAAEREHKPGEVWREPNGDLYLVTHGYATTGEYLTVRLTGERCAHISELEETEDDESDDTFAYPSLAAAVAAGEIK